MSEIVLPQRRVRGCCGMVQMPAMTAAQVDVSHVRRAVLPWRRRVQPSVCDTVPDRLLGRGTTGVRHLAHFTLRLICLLVALVMLVPALVELVLALALMPLAKARRRRRAEWPVQLVTAGRVVHTELCPTDDAARERTFEMRMELIHLEPFSEVDEPPARPAA